MSPEQAAIERAFHVGGPKNDPFRKLFNAEPVESFTIITTDANEMLARIHDRMRAILAEEDHAAWLDPANEKADALRTLLRSYSAEGGARLLDQHASTTVGTRGRS